MIQEITHFFHRQQKASSRILQHAKRSNDAIIILRQDNDLHSLKIEALNLLAIRMLGYENEEIVEHDLSLILPENINQLIDDNLQFNNHSNNIDAILNRVANFKIKTKNKVEIPAKIKIIRSLSSAEIARFQVVLNDSSLMESLAANRLAYRHLMLSEDIFDRKTSLLTKASICKDIELIASYTERSLNESCFVIYRLAESATNEVLRGMIKTIEATKRGNDIVGILEHNTVIVLLPETSHENVKIAISRIYGKLSAETKTDLKVFYDMIKTVVPAEVQLKNALQCKAETF